MKKIICKYLPEGILTVAAIVFYLSLFWPFAIVHAEIQPETAYIEVLPVKPHPHWVWINDVVFSHAEAGKSFLVDGDSGEMLGMLSTGFAFINLAIPNDYSELYSPETYYSRGSRGERTDIVAVYDSRTLTPITEIKIPPKRAESLGTLYHSVLTDDDRFLAIYNFTPAQSISIVDIKKRKFIDEISVPGCALIYPIANRLNTLCADGTLLSLTLDNNGHVINRVKSKPFFDPTGDYLSEKPVRIGDSYLFVSNEGFVHPVEIKDANTPDFGRKWTLFTNEERSASWKIGGIQHLAVHEPSKRLYSLVHQGGNETHKNPGNEIWVYDLLTRKQVQRIKLIDMATSIQVSKDDKPLLFTISPERPVLEIYDALSGNHLRTVKEIGFSPSLLQTPPLL